MCNGECKTGMIRQPKSCLTFALVCPHGGKVLALAGIKYAGASLQAHESCCQPIRVNTDISLWICLAFL